MANNPEMSRRDFIRAGTAAAGAAVVGAHSRARAAGANGRLNLAVIGCGGMASHHLEKLLAMQEDANIAVVAVCDVYGKRAREFAREVSKAGGNARVLDDYRRVLDMDDVDSVLVATPEHSHACITLDALDAGKHVYCEKPLTHTIPEALAVVRKVEETGLKLQVGVQGMADDSYRSAFDAIRAGKIGKVVQAQIDYVRNYGDAGPWRTGVEDGAPQPADLDWEAWVKPAAPRPWNPHHYFEWRCYRDYSGGVATDLFVHRVTRLIAACGLAFPERVTGMGGIYSWPDGRDLPDSFELLAQYPAVEGVSSGLTLHVLGTMANDHGNKHCIRGTSATLEFTGEGWEIKDGESGEVLEKHRKTGGEDVDPHHRNHHAAIRDGADLNCPAVLGLYGVAVVRMANLSWFDGKTYAWDAGAMEARPV